MLVFSAFVPHPPLVIPEIGKDDAAELTKTYDAMNEMSRRLSETDPDTIVVISSHGIIDSKTFLISGSINLKGSFAKFEHPELDFEFEGDLPLAKEIVLQAKEDEIKAELYQHDDEHYHLDHGVLVPLYFLKQELGSDVKILAISHTYDSRLKHLAFGESLRRVVGGSNKRIAVIASGDLSHRAFEKTGRMFDENLVNLLSENKLDEAALIDEDLLEGSGECGYLNMLILLGLLKAHAKVDVLSYEAPFGIGYLVAGFN